MLGEGEKSYQIHPHVTFKPFLSYRYFMHLRWLGVKQKFWRSSYFIWVGSGRAFDKSLMGYVDPNIGFCSPLCIVGCFTSDDPTGTTGPLSSGEMRLCWASCGYRAEYFCEKSDMQLSMHDFHYNSLEQQYTINIHRRKAYTIVLGRRQVCFPKIHIPHPYI